MKKRLISAPITHREIPMQIGLENTEYKFEEPIDNNEWRFLSKK